MIDDCIIIGAGPAGLTAAIYLARFHLRIRLFDNGSSRAALIPRTNNHAGYGGGIWINGREKRAGETVASREAESVEAGSNGGAEAAAASGATTTDGATPTGETPAQTQPEATAVPPPPTIPRTTPHPPHPACVLPRRG